MIYAQPPAENSLPHVSLEKITCARVATEKLYEVVGAVRNLRAENRINAKQAVDFLITPKNEPWNDEQITIFSALTRAKKVTQLTQNAPQGSPSVITDLGTINMPMDDLIDIDAEKKRLRDEITKVEIELIKVKSKLDNADFVQKVPAAVLQEHHDRQDRWKERLTALQIMFQSFESK